LRRGKVRERRKGRKGKKSQDQFDWRAESSRPAIIASFQHRSLPGREQQSEAFSVLKQLGRGEKREKEVSEESEREPVLNASLLSYAPSIAM
jgi:hypothetical protein